MSPLEPGSGHCSGITPPRDQTGSASGREVASPGSTSSTESAWGWNPGSRAPGTCPSLGFMMGTTTKAQVPFLSRGMTEKTPRSQGLINPLTLKSQSRGNHVRRAGNSGEKLPRNDSQRVTSTAIQLHDILEKAKLWRQ